MVLILPSTISNVSVWKELQKFFCIAPKLNDSLSIDDESFPIPIYFAFENEELMKVYNELKTKETLVGESPNKRKSLLQISNLLM